MASESPNIYSDRSYTIWMNKLGRKEVPGKPATVVQRRAFAGEGSWSLNKAVLHPRRFRCSKLELRHTSPSYDLVVGIRRQNETSGIHPRLGFCLRKVFGL